ncbi:cytochrome c peroxidase [Aureisphaera galaxeae]|uniref:cytochrome c peroxidase n=1 Tax=Aureisphaera galaxeae TaxID=1538023 RepID=UPI0023507F0C|nr:cytochrome c peroxidase [Aureisphaera galaxeae]MDC8002579.1 cytochrome c peroxidase [Aureisphaera galaxeae]
MKKILVNVTLLLGFGWLFISATVDLDNLFNYANQEVPDYITEDNTDGNPIDDKTATLGRVLFYDKNLSSTNTIACASCHIQERAFGDPAVQSVGVNGLTGRHSMRLVNPRFAHEHHFFWDERAETLEDQTTQPIQDHIEMGYSGTNGDPTMEDLINHLESLDYYNTLFEFAFGDTEITENRLKLALAQFMRSMQSFDSRFDEGMALVDNYTEPFPNFTPQENMGKSLFINTPNEGAGCADCHFPPEFSITTNTQNNGVIGVAGMPGEIDLTNTKPPTLRDLVNPDGTLNSPLMHDGSFNSLMQVVNHYNAIPDNPENTSLDGRLTDLNGDPQQLNLSEAQKQALVAFLRTLTGSDIYTNEKWSDPFDPDGSITIIGGTLGISEASLAPFVSISPNPVDSNAAIETNLGQLKLWVYSSTGKLLSYQEAHTRITLDFSNKASGLYFVKIMTEDGLQITKRLLKK